VRIATILIQNLIRLLGVVLIVLGILFWTGHSFQLVPLHMRLGETLAGLLIILAILGIVARLNPGLTIGAILWALLVVFFGMNMSRMLPGAAHEAIRVLHFLIGLAAIALAESLGARIKRKLAAAR
jgi:hypothetical protein